ncbi:MAG TPA: tetratricopeptide repeat protein [Conexibacter sp.]|jgi:tetratricopeptide (TPR) repeat protein|nr:tetratricopeptide repeat protein [Conexibacter sp.]
MALARAGLLGVSAERVAMRKPPPPTPVPLERRDLLDAATGALMEPRGRDRAIVLVGQAGSGKTVAAKQLAQGLRERFPDGVVWVDGATFAPQRSGREQFAEGLLRVLGVGSERLPPQGERASLARELLRRREVLVVIDGIDDEGQVLDFVPHRNWGSAMILTSRARPRLDVAQLEIPPLAAAESFELLRRITGEPLTPENREVRTELVRFAQGHPLYLSLLGAQLAQRPDAVPDLLLQLRNEATRSSFDTAERDPSHAALTAAYGLLGNDGAALLRAIGMLEERFELEDLELVAGASDDDRVVAALDELLLSGLLQREDDGTYRIHPIVRRFAREQLLSHEETDTDRLATGLRRRGVEQEILVDRHHHFVPRTPSDRIEIEEYALRVAVEQRDTLSQAHALANLGALHLAAGDLDDAEAALHASVGVARSAGDQRTAAQSALALGHVARAGGRLDRARERYVECAQLFSYAQEVSGRVLAQTALGDVYVMQGDLQEARAIYERTLAESGQQGAGIRAHVEGRLAWVAELAGDVLRGRELYLSALQHAELSGDDDERAELMTRLGFLEARAGDLDMARELIERALHAHRRAGNPPDAARAALALGGLAVGRGDLVRARHHFEEAADLAESSDRRLAALAAYGRGVVATASADAIELLELALALFREVADRLGEAQALQALVEPLRRVGDDSGAQAARASASALFERLGVQPTAPEQALRALTIGAQDRALRS